MINLLLYMKNKMLICNINYDKKNIIISKVLFLLFLIFYNINIISQLNSMISYLKLKYEIKKNDNFCFC